MKRRLGIGIVGFGHFAEKWLVSALANSQKAKLVAVQARTRRVQIPGVRVYSEVRELLADPHVDAVYVTSPNKSHEKHVEQALKAGKHVLCEKPMAITIAQGRRMVAVARKERRYLAVGHMLRFSPSLQFVKQLIDQNAIGQVRGARVDFSYRLNLRQRRWSTIKAISGGGALMDAGIHSLDSLRYVLGVKTLRVLSCQISPRSSRAVETSAICSFELPGGGFASLTVNSDAAYGSSLELVGETGRIRLDGFVRCRGEATLTIEHERQMRTTTKQSVIKIQGVYEKQIDAFCLASQAKSPSLESALNGLANLEILQALYQRSSHKL